MTWTRHFLWLLVDDVIVLGVPVELLCSGLLLRGTRCSWAYLVLLARGWNGAIILISIVLGMLVVVFIFFEVPYADALNLVIGVDAQSKFRLFNLRYLNLRQQETCCKHL